MPKKSSERPNYFKMHSAFCSRCRVERRADDLVCKYCKNAKWIDKHGNAVSVIPSPYQYLRSLHANAKAIMPNEDKILQKDNVCNECGNDVLGHDQACSRVQIIECDQCGSFGTHEQYCANA